MIYLRETAIRICIIPTSPIIRSNDLQILADAVDNLMSNDAILSGMAEIAQQGVRFKLCLDVICRQWKEMFDRFEKAKEL